MAYSVLSDNKTEAKATTAADGARRDPMRWVVLAILILLLAFTLFPFFLALLNAFKASAEYAVGGPLSIPRSIDLTAIKKFWTVSDFSRKLLNSVVISLAVSVLGVLISLFNAYAIGVGKVPGSRVILVVFLLGIMVPQESIIYPLYYMAKASGLYDTQLSVIIIFAVLQSAFGTYLLSTVLSTFPKEILEAAEMDGSTHWKTLWFVVVPVLRPTLMVLGTFFFIWTWNEFLIPLVMLVSNNNQTVSVAMGLTRGQNMSDPVLQASAAFLGIIPTVIFFLIFQRTLTRGIAAGAVK
ncbi:MULTISPECIES: carbohydrate ABC transporter permease [Rhizobium]|uniref:carbohydrate ABC transporter permease n=1 Tax=Rhizobium phaseoli TaxID=396 RepID=UPI000202E795|nr:carbohydrate ABC transporter permease [Rhizobium phaseoli]ANL37674.1 sugar ABC transporter permease protein [Rhizobium phaseoli]ANM01385.1 sugar ABC transporter permease protein [Rhizobium phaseoli]EGE55370.1 putative sugar ABC transporter, permease protein [Rhizobium etli CNPAF512]RUM15013.1 carbohydrate ABC transporter permease [Rhizobium phaseoli]